MKRSNKACLEINKLYKCVLKTLISIDNSIAKSFLNDLPPAYSLDGKKIESKILPITDVLKLITQKNSITSELIEAIISIDSQQPWRQPYDIDDFGEHFYHNAGWFPIADIEGPLVYKKGLIEIMLLNADTKYPKHSHSPEELYLVLNGKVWWESEQEGSFCWKEAGEIIHHPPNCTHSIQSGDDPVLILALWRAVALKNL